MTTPDTDLAAALELIGKQPDVVAVKLPEPVPNVANPTWVIGTDDGGCEVVVSSDGTICGDAHWSSISFRDTNEAREFAVGVLSAAALVDGMK